MLPPKRTIRFVHALVAAGRATRRADTYVAGDVALAVADLNALSSAGVVAMDGETCRATAEARSWLKRAMLDADAFAAQHRIEARGPEGVGLNLAESPLARLAASSGGGAAFLAPHQVEAGERVRRLVERAALQPRVTMSYSAAHTAGGQLGRAAEITDMASEARRQLDDIQRELPADCAGVVLDVCGFLKGLQLVETERGWPRRSAKLVLRIGLEQAAQHFGLMPEAVGIASRRRRAWLDDGARPTRFE